MKKTQTIDWDDANFIDRFDNIELWIRGERFPSTYLDQDFIAAFDEMLENEIKNRVDKFPVVWDDVNGWKPLWIETGAHYYLNNA